VHRDKKRRLLSAFGSEADEATLSGYVRFTPKADKQEKARLVRFVPKADIRIAADLFDHLVGQREQPVGKFKAERLCGLEIDRELILALCGSAVATAPRPRRHWPG
jgi:hypothetical protein